jgi:hypothetical protein
VVQKPPLLSGTKKSWGTKRIGPGIMTGYGLDHPDDGVRVPVGTIIFTSPRHPDRHWGPPTINYPMGTGG